jgi:hypothetical protein
LATVALDHNAAVTYMMCEEFFGMSVYSKEYTFPILFLYLAQEKKSMLHQKVHERRWAVTWRGGFSGLDI